MSPGPPTSKPYPYRILMPKVDKNALGSVSLWDALEFFRIEALLRSENVQSLYEENATGEILYEKYGFTWGALAGEHHRYLRPSTMEQAGIVDLRKWETLTPASALVCPVRSDPSRFLHLQLDCAVPPTTVIKALQSLLREHHRNLEVALEDDGPVFGLRSPAKRPPIHDVAAWLTYLRCYDLRQCYGLSFGKIAQQVFGKVVKRGAAATRARRSRYDQAERGYKAIKRLIRSAVSGSWPPHFVSSDVVRSKQKR